MEDLDSIPGLGTSPGEGTGYPLQYSGLENAIVHGVVKSWTRLSDSLSLSIAKKLTNHYVNGFHPGKNSV